MTNSPLQTLRDALAIEFPNLNLRHEGKNEFSVFDESLFISGKIGAFSVVRFHGDFLCSKNPNEIVGDRVANALLNLRKYLKEI